MVSTWRCALGHEAELERLVDDLVGPDGIVMHEAGASEYHVARRFANRDALTNWLASAERATLHARLEELAERVGRPKRLSGLEPWFATIGAPPRWKMWLASFLGAYPLVVLFQWLVAAHVAAPRCSCAQPCCRSCC